MFDFQEGLGVLSRKVEALEKEREEREFSEHKDAIIKFYGQMWEKNSAYSKVIIAAGYGGLFAIWSASRSYLAHSQNIVVALALTFSLLLYSGWEVFTMLYSALVLNRGVSKLFSASLVDYKRVNHNS